MGKGNTGVSIILKGRFLSEKLTPLLDTHLKREDLPQPLGPEIKTCWPGTTYGTLAQQEEVSRKEVKAIDNQPQVTMSESLGMNISQLRVTMMMMKMVKMMMMLMTVSERLGTTTSQLGVTMGTASSTSSPPTEFST